MLLGAYTQRFNRRHRHWGHLFGGRYKAQLIDERSPSYLVAACDYVHLNPVRAGMLETDAPLHSYRWSSYPAYLQVKLRQPWLRVDRVLGGHGLADGTARHRREFSRRMEQRRIDPQDTPELRQGWKVGAEDFADWLADKLSRPGRADERARERNETDRARAERLVLQGLDEIGWSETELIETGKAHPMKIALAKRLRAETPMTRRWIANRLQMGSPSYLSALLCSDNSKL